jgi:lipopolysaccharide/colanic/teichoic acid biosynthesis glycosyltransferase
VARPARTLVIATPKVRLRESKPLVSPATTTCPSYAPTRRQALARPCKRVIDVLGAGVLLFIALPLFAVIALAIKRDSDGPVFFGQWRVGRDMKPFRIWKFRSMYVGAEDERWELIAEYGLEQPLFKLADDPRMTRVGRTLRRWSLDELPQLWNVVRGDMSLVGPRPPLPEEVRADGLRQPLRLGMRPGVTGPWQVNGRSELPYLNGVALDLDYVRDWSIGSDLVILARTPWAVLSRKGAH